MQPSTRPVTVTATKVMSGAMVIMDVLKPRFVAKDDVMVKGDNGANLADITAGDKSVLLWKSGLLWCYYLG